MCCLYLDLSWDLCRMRLWCHCLFPLLYFNHLLKMSLIKSHNHNFFRAKLQCSEKVIFEPFEKEEGTNIEPRTEYHYTYELDLDDIRPLLIRFLCISGPEIEMVNKLIMNIMKNIYKHTFINGRLISETSSQQYEKIIKDSIQYTSFKHLFLARHVGQKDGCHLIHVYKPLY